MLTRVTREPDARMSEFASERVCQQSHPAPLCHLTVAASHSSKMRLSIAAITAMLRHD
jgi:hypothetical protein